VQAVTLGEVITCPDIAEEKRFEPQWQRLGLDHSIRSLQSRPFYLREGKPYGTFVLAFRQPRKETDWDVALMKFAADAAGLIIQSDLDRTNNRRRIARLRCPLLAISGHQPRPFVPNSKVDLLSVVPKDLLLCERSVSRLH
jgi:GAF domain-containing protein